MAACGHEVWLTEQTGTGFIMAYMVTFQSGKADVIVNMELVTYIRGGSDKYCTIHFGGDQSVNVDASALAVIGLAQNGTMLPSKKA